MNKPREKFKIVFMGTPAFAVQSLEILLNSGYDIAAVVTAPDKHAGRGLKFKASEVKLFAQEKGLKLLQPDSLKNIDFVNTLTELKADLFVVVAFRMLPEIVWSIPAYGTINLHASLLPQYRGAAPINWAIINGEKKTGITTFLIDHEIDTGKLLLQKELNIGDDETAGELHDRLMIEGARLLLKTVDDLRNNKLIPVAQNEYISGIQKLNKAPKIFKEDCRINWRLSALEVFNLIRGLSPYPAAYTILQSKDGVEHHLKIFRAKLSDYFEKDIPGTIQINDRKMMFICAGDSWIELTEVQLEGKKRMSVYDFLNGFKIEDGLQAV
ncbi:MAG: methionyl-tRNA formyltransferase [Bacteroidales bacterium]